MSEAMSELKTGQNEIWEGLAKVFDGARNEAVKLPSGHELKHGEVWGALAGTAIVGAGLLLGLDPTRQKLDNVFKFTEWDSGKHPTILEFLNDICFDQSQANGNLNTINYGVWFQGPANYPEQETLRGILGLSGSNTLYKLHDELAMMSMNRVFRNIISMALVGSGFVSGILAVTAEKAKEKVVWSDTIGPLLARGIRAMNNVSEA